MEISRGKVVNNIDHDLFRLILHLQSEHAIGDDTLSIDNNGHTDVDIVANALPQE